jgi:hypothetical protein
VSTSSSALERARADIANGRPDLARERLYGFLYTLHTRGEYRQDVYLLLGEVLFAMKDFARAGAAWLLTERDDADALFAFEAFQARYGKNTSKGLDVVKPHAPSEHYPPKVQERLQGWNYRYVPYRSRSQPRIDRDAPLTEQAGGVRPIEAGCIIVSVIGVVLACLFFYTRLNRH